MEQIICVTSPSTTKIIVLMRKDVFIQWAVPADAGCLNGAENAFSPEFNRAFNRTFDRAFNRNMGPAFSPNLNRLRAVTGIRG